MQKASAVKQSASSDRSQGKTLAVGAGATATNTSRSKDDNFDLEENDNWPEVDLGNLIIGLDADIDKANKRSLSPASSSSASMAMSASKTKTLMGSQTVTESLGNGTPPPTSTGNQSGSTSTSGGGAGGNANTSNNSTNSTSNAGGASSSSSNDKSLKVKIKRTKPSGGGSSRHSEGNLEVVQSNNSEMSPNGRDANSGALASKSGDLNRKTGATSSVGSTPLNAADVISAVTTAVARQSSASGKNVIGKVKLTSGPMASSSLTLHSSKASGASTTTSSQNGKISSNGASATSSPSPSYNARANGSLSPQSFLSTSSTSHANGPASTAGFTGNQNGPPPCKKQKVDASVSTDTGTITEPECLGPMDPGSSVTLEGIVWHETENGVLVINVTWRGKTYVGTLLDSTQHVHQWAPPSSRFTDSPTSELEGRTSKGRGKRGRGGHSEHETRKNLRSSKGKGRSSQISFPPASPAKRKTSSKSDSEDKNGSGSGSEDGSASKKRSRTSSQNSPEDEGDDSEKEDKPKDGEKESKSKEDKEDDSMTPKDPEEEKYVPPPPLPYALVCPKDGCNKKYRQHSGLKFHVSFAHKELLNAQGEIRDTSEIERMENEAKERIRKKEEALSSDRKASDADSKAGDQSADKQEGVKQENLQGTENGLIQEASHGKSSSPAPGTLPATMTLPPPLDLGQSLPPLTTPAGMPPLSQLKPNFTNLPGPPSDAKPIPVSAIEGVMTSRPPPPLLNGPPVVTMPSGSSGGPAVTTPVSLMGSIPISSALSRPSDPSRNPPMAKSIIRPPSNARPIVPATAPQLLQSGSLGPSAINLKPIQPRPTIMPEPTPNLALDELRKKKEPKRKKENSPGTSPPRGGSQNGSSPKSGHGHGVGQTPDNNQQPPVKSPAYSDISDDGEETDKKKTGSSCVPLPPNLAPPVDKPPFAPPFPFPPYVLPPSSRTALSPQLPTVPVSSIGPSMHHNNRPRSRGSPSVPKEAKGPGMIGGPPPGTLEYQKLLQSYGFPPFPYPIPQGMDPNMHMHLLAMDPAYKGKFERERAEKEKVFKDQIDRDNRERDRKASGGGIKEEGGHRIGVGPPSAEDLRKRELMSSPAGSLSVKSEFREAKSEPGKTEKPHSNDEGAKPTMETRGPPPGSQAYGYMQAQMLRQGFPGLPFEHLLASGMNPLMLGAAGAYGPNPYLPPHMRQAFGPSSPSDMLRPPMFPPTSSAGGGLGSPEDLRSSNTKALELLQQHANQFYNSQHKIHELQDRALKSPNNDKFGHKGREALASSSPTLSRKNPSTPTPPPPSSSASSLDRGRSPPPLRHVHTHTHTHFGLGYPLLPPTSVALSGVTPPAAHTPFSSAGFNPLLPPKPSLPGFPPK